MIDAVFLWTVRFIMLCSVAVLIRLMIGPRGGDRLTALSVLSAFVLGILVLYGSRGGRLMYLDVALVYDIFGFLGLLAIASFFRGKE